jgi:Icc-related predicted phosphoesterase
VTCSLKILVLSDFHGSSQAFNHAAAKMAEPTMDLAIICGDVTNFGSVEEAKKLLALVSKTELPVLYVPGNCDPPQLTREEMGHAKCIHDTCMKVQDVAFFGVGGSPPTPFRTPFELSEGEIDLLLHHGFDQCSRGGKTSRTVLVSHSPPRGTCLDLTSGGEHVGSSSVRRFVEEKRPALVLCGHIHEASGLDKIGSSVIVNPGPARHNQCAVIDLDDKIEATILPLH